jgi:hypothetical protein
MRRDRCVMLLIAMAVVFAASPLFAGAPRRKAQPRLTQEQATRRLTAIAKEFGVPLDEGATARFAGSTWTLGSRSSRVLMRDGTGQILEVGRPSVETKPIAKEQAMAAAAHVLKVAGAPPDAKLGEAELVGKQWQVRYGRQTAEGTPYDDDRAGILIGPDGLLQLALLHWSPAPPPASTKVEVTKQQAVQAAKGFVKRSRLPGSYDQLIETSLCVVQPNDRYSGRRPKPAAADPTTPTRVAWAVSFPRPLSGSLTKRSQMTSRFRPSTRWVREVVWIDAANAKVLGGRSASAGEPPAEVIKQIIAQRRTRIASVSGGVVAASLVLGVVVWVRRRGRRAAQAA